MFKFDCENALAVAEFLEDHKQVNAVRYPFLKSHPQYDIAVKQMKKGGNIIIQEQEAYVEPLKRVDVIRITDEGEGFPQEIKDQIFDPFFTTKEVGKGTGLGLSVVNSIVEGHQGKIEVQNLSPKGCRFRVVFPVGVEQ